MAILAVSSFSQRLNDLKIVTHNEQQLMAFYQAEAALKRAETSLQESANVSIENLGQGYYRITATGQSKDNMTTQIIVSYFSLKHGRISWSML